jgi:transposase
MGRFKNLDHLAGYCGLVPDERSSGEKTRILGLTKRRNPHLRTALVESAWVAIRTDDKLRQTYQKALGEAKTPQVAIIKVARRLLNRVRAVWLQGRPYDKDHAPGQGQPADGGSGGT